MYENKTLLALIPARGGSKRLPRKNVLELAGKPLIGWTIDAGLQSRYIDRVVVTSDDEEILEIAQHWGAETLERPAELGSDTSTTFDAVEHAMQQNEKFDYVVLLQPTSPLRNAHHIDQAIELLFKKQADAVVSVCEMEHTPLWSNTLPEDGSMEKFLPEEIKNKRSQDLPKHYRLNGAIYICQREKLLEQKTFFLISNIYAYIMDQMDSVDIDTMLDLEFARFLKKGALGSNKS